MAPVQKQPDDYVIIRRPGSDVRGGGMVEMWSLTGPDIPPSEANRPRFRTYEDAERDGRERAKARHVSLWYEQDPSRNEGTLAVSYRE